MTSPRRVAIWAAAVSLLVAGCDGPVAAVSPSPSVTAWTAAACQQAAAGVGRTVQRLVDAYNTPQAAVVVRARANPADGDPDVRGALDTARRAVLEHGCSSAALKSDLERGLAAVEARGAIAQGVRNRVLAGIGGRIGSAPVDVTLAPGADLVDEVAVTPAGSTLRLGPGEYRLTSSLVLLDAVTIRGSGPDATVIRSSAPEASVFVLAGDRVELVDLAVIRPADAIGSGIVAGGTASLVLDRVRVSGARAAEAQGGAGVLMVDSDAEASSRGTTLEVTDSVFSDNGWAGLAVTGSHRVSVVGSTFTGNGECGLCFQGAAGGSVRESIFKGNQVGVAVGGTARPVLAANAVTGGVIGLQVEGEAAPTADGNRITGASRAAVFVGGSATGTIARTTCLDVPSGIVVSDKAAPTLVDNRCELSRGVS